MGHFKKICGVCEKVVEQCRCPDEDKTVIKIVCIDCAKKIRGQQAGTCKN